MKQHDEYEWNNYTQEYSAQLAEIKRDDNQDFFITNFTDENGQIIFKDNLHNNWKEIYSSAYNLKPTSMLEVGCGGCYHLKNMRTILPNCEIHGVDLLQSQLDYGKTFSSLPEDISNNLNVMDLTKEKPNRQYEFVFSQAVVMHLSTENAKLFLENMKQTSSKYVFMIEGIKNHEGWYDLVKSVFTDWDFSQPNRFVDYSILLTKK